MIELLRATIQLANLPFTILLLLILFYWLSVIIGVADTDIFSVDPDADVDADTDADLEGGPKVIMAFLRFLNVGDVPIMVVLSFLVLFLWSISMIANHYLNPNYFLMPSLAILPPNLVVSILLTSLITKPFKKVFSSLNIDPEAGKAMHAIGRVLTSEVNEGFGQVEILTRGAPITINARTTDGKVFKKGEQVLVYDQDKEKGVYFVEEFNE